MEFTVEFEAWWDDLTEDEQDDVDARVRQLEQVGPTLRRPTVGEIVGSAYDPQMKELRVGTSIRVLFVFDPRRTAILLLGGHKAGQWKAWYVTAIPEADRLYAEHLDQLRREGLI